MTGLAIGSIKARDEISEVVVIYIFIFFFYRNLLDHQTNENNAEKITVQVIDVCVHTSA